MAKGAAVRFVDKAEDSADVARLVEQLREVIAHYQVSEYCFVAPSVTHIRADIATTIDLRPNH